MPTAMPATIGRVLSKVFIAPRKPSLRPSALASGTRQPSRISSAVSLARSPIFFSILPTLKPGVPFSTTKARCASRPFDGSLVAKITTHSARPPLVMKHLLPSRIQWSPSLRQVVLMAATSLPAPAR